jgi:glycine/D-amino acid oxidase-like deaminating enzyme
MRGRAISGGHTAAFRWIRRPEAGTLARWVGVRARRETVGSFMSNGGMRIAVIGAGLTGSSLAIMLARAGHAVTVFEENAAPLVGASRWNEGRLHLGYVYGADSTLNTARRFIPAAVRFRPIMNDLLGQDISSECTTTDDTYLVHRRSVIAPDPLEANLRAIDALVREHPDADSYITPLSRARIERLDQAAVEAIANPQDVVAGFRVPERSVETQWLCDRLAEVLLNTPGLELRMSEAVAAARPVDLPGGRWEVVLADGRREVFDRVANASWNSLLEIDQSAGLALDFEWSHRFRLSIFATTAVPVPVDSMFVAVGPFGILKNHHDRKFYISWYETGLRTYTEGVKAIGEERLDDVARAAFLAETRAALEHLMPPIARVFENASELKVEGGFVLAQATGDIGRPEASLHRRDKFGIRRLGNYVSIDTGKFATAPYIAEHAASEHFGLGTRSRLRVGA